MFDKIVFRQIDKVELFFLECRQITGLDSGPVGYADSEMKKYMGEFLGPVTRQTKLRPVLNCNTKQIGLSYRIYCMEDIYKNVI